jgi:hypothetical protein
MTDNSALVNWRNSHAVTGKPPAVPAKVKAAVEILLTLDTALDYAALAKQVGYCSAAELRRWLTKPQSIKYHHDRKFERLQQINAANPEALRKVRDESENAMAKVQAVRTLESMEAHMDEQAGGRAARPAPGAVIVIEQPDGSLERRHRPAAGADDRRDGGGNRGG